MRIFKIISFFLLSTALSFAQDLPLHLLKLPRGFQIEIYAKNLPGARQLAEGDQGTIFVGSRGDTVYAISHKDNETRVNKIATGLNYPNGVAFKSGSLYVAEIDRVVRYDNIENNLTNPPKPVVINNKLPKETHHGFRYIKFGPDGKLYIGIGMPCNVCLLDNPIFGTIIRMNPDGSHDEIYAKGIRNTVGFAWDPLTQHLWFTDNGRDYLGDNSPPDKVNYAPTSGMHFGFPFYNGKDLPDPQYGNRFPQKNFTMPTFELPPHVAALGMTFYQGNHFPTQSGISQAFIAEHGSWNRSTKVGYQVIRAFIQGNKVLKVEPFVTGWLQNQTAFGRPVDVLVTKDGNLLISDDTAGVIYRVVYTA